MLNVSGTDPTSALDLFGLTTTAASMNDLPHPRLSLRPPDEHSRGGSGPDGARSRGGGRGGGPTSRGEGGVSVLLRHAEEQQGVQPNTGGGAKEPG